MLAATTMCKTKPAASCLACLVKPLPMVLPMRSCRWTRLRGHCWPDWVAPPTACITASEAWGGAPGVTSWPVTPWVSASGSIRQRFPAFQCIHQSFFDLRVALGELHGLGRVVCIELPISQGCEQCGLFRLQLLDQRGQSIKFSLFLVAEFAACSGLWRSRIGRRRFSGHGFIFYCRSFASVPGRAGEDLAGPLGLDQPVLHAAFVLSPLAFALPGNGAGDHVVEE